MSVIEVEKSRLRHVSTTLLLYSARLRDLWRLRGWRNDPVVVQQLISQRRTGVIEHLRWCLGVVARSREVVLAGWNEDGVMIGIVRLRQCNRGTPEWVVGVIVDPGERNRGYGVCLVGGAKNYAFEFLDCENLIAQVHVQNEPSLRTFAAAGFDEIRERSGSFVNLVSKRPAVNEAGA